MSSDLPICQRCHALYMSKNKTNMCPTCLEEKFLGCRKDIEFLESQLRQSQAELNETYIDENGETWFRPTAEAYYAACKARNKWQEQSEEWRVDRDFFLTRLEDEKIKVEKLEAENAALESQLALTEKALELACEHVADNDCPHEYSWAAFQKPECENCTHMTEKHQDTDRDIKCWMEYFLQGAKAGDSDES